LALKTKLGKTERRAMTTSSNGSTKSLLSATCFYVASYLGFTAACITTYEAVLWYRTGFWSPHLMRLLLAWSGWYHPPALGMAGIQPFIDRAWETIGDCSISTAFAIAAIAIAGFGLARNAVVPRDGYLRDVA
jgi:hypothetical protein